MIDHHDRPDAALTRPRAWSALGRRSAESADVAILPLTITAALVGALLIAFAHGYGYHRDELYFLAAGQHLAWSYPDQGVLTPLIAHLMNSVAPESLTVLRVPSAFLAAATVFTTGLTAFELGAERRAQIIACVCAAVSAVVLAVGHLLSTTTFDLFAWTAVCWLVVRILRTGDARPWLAVGFLGGVALLNKPLIAVFFAALGITFLVRGPRWPLRSPWLWIGAVIALAFWSPWLIWQASHGWPQLHISSAIANGRSASSQPRWAFLPFQLLLVSPVLAPVWIVGLLDLLRSPRLRRFRSLGFTWLLLAVLFLIAGGKPYYLAGMFPVLIAAGSPRVAEWTERGSRRTRRTVLAVCVALSGLVSAVIALPILPARRVSVVVSVNADVGETIGWPEFVRAVQRVYRSAGGRVVILTANYGEAGAIDHYGPALGLPPAYSGHNGFAQWGPPHARAGATIVVGLSGAQLQRWFSFCVQAGHVRNSAGISNQEEGAPIDRCSRPRRPWSSLWPSIRHLS